MPRSWIPGYRPAVPALLREIGIEEWYRGRPRLQRRTSFGGFGGDGRISKRSVSSVSAPALALAAEKPRRRRNYTARISATLRLSNCARGNGARRGYVLPNERRAPCVEGHHRPRTGSIARWHRARCFCSTSWPAPPRTGINAEIAVPDTIGVSTTACTKTATGHGFIGMLPSIARSAADGGGPRETHRVRLHAPGKIAQRLQQCGFSVDMADAIGPVETLPRRVAFICRKAAC